LLECFWN